MTTGRTVTIGQLLARIVFRDQSAEGIRSANANLSRFQQRLTGARARINALSDRLGAVSVQAGIFGAALTAASAALVREAGNVEAAWARIEGQVGLTVDEIEEIQPRVAAIGAQFGLAEAEAANAFFTIASAGLRGERALETFEAAAQGTAGGLGTLSELTQLLITSTTAWSDSGLTASRVMDELSAAVRVGNFQAADLVPAFTRVASTFASMGVEANDVLTAFSVMSRVQPNLARNATGLEGIFRQLVSPTDQFAEALAMVGVNSDTLVTSLRQNGLIETVFNIRDAFGDNEDAFVQLFATSQEALTGVTNLTRGGRELAETLRSEVVNSVGAADDVFSAFEGTVNLLTREQLAAMRNAMAELGAVLVPLFTQVVSQLTAVFQFLSGELERGNTALQFLIVAFGIIGPALLFISAAIRGLLIPLRLLSAAIGVLNLVMSLNPIGAILLGIGLMITALAAAVIYWEQIWNFVSGIGRLIGGIFGFGGTSDDEEAATRRLRTGVTGEVPSFQRGGLVPGSIGEPMLALVHGGEYVVPAPVVSAAASGGDSFSRTNITGDIIINVDGTGSPEQVARRVREEIESLTLSVTTSTRSGIDT